MHMHMHMYMCMQNRTGSIDGATRAAYYNAALERATDYKGKAVFKHGTGLQWLRRLRLKLKRSLTVKD